MKKAIKFILKWAFIIALAIAILYCIQSWTGFGRPKWLNPIPPYTNSAQAPRSSGSQAILGKQEFHDRNVLNRNAPGGYPQSYPASGPGFPGGPEFTHSPADGNKIVRGPTRKVGSGPGTVISAPPPPRSAPASTGVRYYGSASHHVVSSSTRTTSRSGGSVSRTASQVSTASSSNVGPSGIPTGKAIPRATGSVSANSKNGAGTKSASTAQPIARSGSNSSASSRSALSANRPLNQVSAQKPQNAWTVQDSGTAAPLPRASVAVVQTGNQPIPRAEVLPENDPNAQNVPPTAVATNNANASGESENESKDTLSDFNLGKGISAGWFWTVNFLTRGSDNLLPTAHWYPNRIGTVVCSPYAFNFNGAVNVAGFAPGTKVICPYSKRAFRVPELDE